MCVFDGNKDIQLNTFTFNSAIHCLSLASPKSNRVVSGLNAAVEWTCFSQSFFSLFIQYSSSSLFIDSFKLI